MNVHFLQDSIQHQAPVSKGTRINRPQAKNRNQRFNATPIKGGSCKKAWKQYSKVIGNPAMRSAGAEIIWNQV